MDSDFAGPVNLGSSEMISINQLVRTVAEIAGKDIRIKHIPGPLGVAGRNSNNDLIRDKLGWAPSRPLREGLEKLYAWVAEQVEKEKQHGAKIAVGG
jgi:nucleoside-diphosphate-sugar epimerase